MYEQDVVTILKQLQDNLELQQAKNSANQYLLMLLAKSDPNLHTISNEYGELLIHLSQQGKANLATLEEMKKILHTLHEMFLKRSDFSERSPAQDGKALSTNVLLHTPLE